MQAEKVISDIVAKEKEHTYKKVITLGHSEGSDVVAKLGAMSDQVTHVGYWSGSGNSQWYDFPLFIRQQVNQKLISEEEGLVQLDSLLDTYRDIMAHKDDVSKSWYGHSYKRWYEFSEPPINNLLKINVPLFAAMGTLDQAIPIESFYLLPVEFIRNGKENLTFKVYPGLDHSFSKHTKDGQIEQHWDMVFKEFIKWIGEN